MLYVKSVCKDNEFFKTCKTDDWFYLKIFLITLSIKDNVLLLRAFISAKKSSFVNRRMSFISDPVWIRTKDLFIRSELLYPAELRGQKIFLLNWKKKGGWSLIPLVGAAGFEPATSWSQTRRDDRTTLRPELKFFWFQFFCFWNVFQKASAKVIRLLDFTIFIRYNLEENRILNSKYWIKLSFLPILFCGESEIRTRGTVTRTSA